MLRISLPVLLLLASPLAAQRPLPGLPMTPPPTAHPGLVGQPLIGPTGGQLGGPTSAGGDQRGPSPGCAPARAPVDPDTVGIKARGKTLAKRVKELAQLDWHEDLEEARVQSAATGKPVFWIQALGDIDGFA